MRLFLGFPLPEGARAALDAACAPLREAVNGRGASWVPAENLHLTLRFLGETDRRGIDSVTSRISSVVQGMLAPRLRLGGPGVFPSRGGRALVFWAGLEGELEPLKRLAGSLERCARRAGFPPERRAFRAHVTLARLRGPRGLELEGRVLPAFPAVDCTPRAVHLFQSVSGSRGVEYPTLRSWPFCPAPPPSTLAE
ncbi:MAG: RNA 2',3'-cyclic phosphodiesterase [Planctomycetota bacterium]